ncbi:MAG: molecular chaperone DnaJ [Minisyncoccales bacterium]
MTDYYQILGISRDANQEEIKKAYRKLAHKHHPDKGGSEAKFKEINQAYQILSNKDKRAQYDRFGRTFDNASQGFDPDFDFASGFGSGAGAGFEFGDFGNIGEIFEEFFGAGSASRRRRDIKMGKDIEIDIEIPLEAVLKNQEKKITLYKMVVCSRCNGIGAEPGTSVKECFTCRGTGQVQQIKRTIFGSVTRYVICPECGGEGTKPEKPCNVCKGEGRIKKEEEIILYIPAGVDTNQVIKIEGKGDAGKKGGEAGDLYVRILVKKHPLFIRRGDDLYISVPITFSQAVLGDEVEVPALDDKKILLKVLSGTESGKVLRISGKGITRFSGFGRGNMYVELEIETPKRLTRTQKELLKKLKEEGI